MSFAHARSGGVQLPVRSIRIGMLAFFAAMAFIEVGAGAVVGQAWKLHRDDGVLMVADRVRLDQLLERLRVMFGVAGAGAAATAVVWSLIAVHNAMRVTRHGQRPAVIAFVAWTAAPIVLLVVSSMGGPDVAFRKAVGVLMLQAVVLYLPFAAIGEVSERVGGPRMPFLRWYLALAAATMVQHIFTSPLDLGHPEPSDDLGRTAVMYFVNAVIIAVMVVMAAEATRSMDRATQERVIHQRLLHDDAHQRVRATPIAVEPPPVPAQVAVPAGAFPPPTPAAGTSFPAPVPAPAPTLTPLSVPVTRGS